MAMADVQDPEAPAKPKRTRKKAEPKPVVAETNGRTPMSDDHKAALAAGREQGRAVKNYIEALTSHKPKRGRKRTAESIQRRLATIDETYDSADALTRLHMAQEKLDLEAELATQDEGFDLSELEDAFVDVAADYSARKGLSKAAWREIGVPPAVLTRAGIR